MDTILNILDVIANNGLLVMGSFAAVSIIIYSIVGMTGRKGQSTFKEGVLWVGIALIAGLSATNISSWIVSNFGG